MKKFVFWHIFVAALLMASNSQAQSLKDLFNKENIEKVVNSVTGKSTARHGRDMGVYRFGH